MANPLVRKEMVFYPQDNGKFMKQAANGKRWMEEVDASLAAPMVRKYLSAGYHDYFIHEPFLASVSADNESNPAPVPLLPVRFFERAGTLFARSHPLLPKGSSYIVDGETHLEIPLSSFLLPLPEFRQEHCRYNLPCPNEILGITPLLFPCT
jgi:hypothetical protein